MKYCIRCIQPDTRPNTKFNEEGLCPACIYFDELQKVDWQERYEILKDIILQYKKHDKQDHLFDCILGVSGGKDSTRQALFVRDKLGLKPLLVCLSYTPQQVTQLGVDNVSNLIELGFDVLISAPAPETWRQLMRISFNHFTNWCRSTELALFSSVPQLAIRYKIPLIFWGENPGLQIGDQATLGKYGYDGNNLRHGNTLNGGNIEWMLNAGIKKSFLLPYIYPEIDAFDQANLQIIYLGWFLGDWSFANNGAYAAVNGFQPRAKPVQDIGDLSFVSSVDEDWVILNQMIKYYKFGFGKVSEYVNEEIRLGRLSRDEAAALAEKYDGLCSAEYIESFCEYIEISVDSFWKQVKQSLNNQLFEIDGNFIKRRFKVGVGL